MRIQTIHGVDQVTGPASAQLEAMGAVDEVVAAAAMVVAVVVVAAAQGGEPQTHRPMAFHAGHAMRQHLPQLSTEEHGCYAEKLGQTSANGNVMGTNRKCGLHCQVDNYVSLT